MSSGATYYYWLADEEDKQSVLGRSNSRAWALRSARRYASNGIGPDAAPMATRVVADLGTDTEADIARFAAGGMQIAGAELAEGDFELVSTLR